MDLSAIIKAELDVEPDQTNRTAPSLRPGDLLTGKVLKLSVDGRILMDFGCFRARTQIDWDVQPGQVFRLEVVESGMPLKLKVRGHGATTAEIPLPQLDFRQAISLNDHRRLLALIDRLVKPVDASTGEIPLPRRILDALGQLKSVLLPMPIRTNENENVDQVMHCLRQAIGGSGLFFEKEMAEVEADVVISSAPHSETSGKRYRSVIANDLKAQLLKLKAFFTGQDGHSEAVTTLPAKEVAFIKSRLEQMVAHLQDQQGHIARRYGEHDPMLVVMHHVYVEKQRQPVKLMVYYPKKGRNDQDKGLNRLAMLLDMDRLGPVRVDLTMFGGSLDVGFFVRNDKVRQAFESAHDMICHALNKVFGRVQVVTRVSEQKIIQFEQEHASNSGAAMVDIQA